MRASEPAEVIEMNREDVQALVQTDAELGEILLRAFILRRVELIAHGMGDVVLLGSVHCADTLRIKEFLTRNGHPFHYVDLDRDRDAQELLDRFQIGVGDVPVVICRGDAVLRNPTNAQIADCLGFNDDIDKTGGACRGGLRRVGRAGCPRARVERARRSGRIELTDRELPGIPHRHLGTGPHRTGIRSGAEIRRTRHDRQGSRAAGLRRPALHG